MKCGNCLNLTGREQQVSTVLFDSGTAPPFVHEAQVRTKSTVLCSQKLIMNLY